jgi:magnesium-transporting ATPase (P-type)
VLQIFLCIVSKIPVMRQPLQILFLILVTDLPPSIALGFEPGEPMTMKRKPRPKTQPVVLNWMWRGIVANGMILTVCIFCTYLIALYAYAGAFLTDDITDPKRESCAIWPKDEWAPTLKIDCGLWTACSTDASSAIYDAACAAYTPPTDAIELAEATAAITAAAGDGAIYTAHGNPDCEICIETSIRRARTSAFISLVWAENFRAYCSRSFERPVWEGTFSNPSMNKAILMAQISLYVALFLPGLNEDVLGLYVYEIHGFGWGIAFIGAMACLVGCEVYKFIAGQYVVKEELAGYEEDADGVVSPSTSMKEVVVNVA